MRLPYAPTEPPEGDRQAAEIYALTAARRAPRPLQPLDLTLLHAPPITGGWNAFIGAVRTQTTIDTDIRELAISRVAALNGAWYEWHHHAPLLKQEGKLEDEGLQTVLREPCLGLGESRLVRRGKGLSDAHWAVFDYTDQMTRHVRVDDAVFERLKESFDQRQVVEITGTIAAYACVSRFLVALDVGEGNGRTMELPSK